MHGRDFVIIRDNDSANNNSLTHNDMAILKMAKLKLIN